MGIRARIKSKLKSAVQDARALFTIVNEEAKHPGRPQPHMVARNPLWGGETGEAPDKVDVPPSEPRKEVNLKTESKSEEEPEMWYLRGDDEGWSDPNPGQS